MNTKQANALAHIEAWLSLVPFSSAELGITHEAAKTLDYETVGRCRAIARIAHEDRWPVHDVPTREDLLDEVLKQNKEGRAA